LPLFLFSDFWFPPFGGDGQEQERKREHHTSRYKETRPTRPAAKGPFGFGTPMNLSLPMCRTDTSEGGEGPPPGTTNTNNHIYID
jgi:hypothetical protein